MSASSDQWMAEFQRYDIEWFFFIPSMAFFVLKMLRKTTKRVGAMVTPRNKKTYWSLQRAALYSLTVKKAVGEEQVTQNDSNTNKKYVAMEKDGARACVGSSWFSAGDSGKLNIHIDIWQSRPKCLTRGFHYNWDEEGGRNKDGGGSTKRSDEWSIP